MLRCQRTLNPKYVRADRTVKSMLARDVNPSTRGIYPQVYTVDSLDIKNNTRTMYDRVCEFRTWCMSTELGNTHGSGVDGV